MKRRTLLGLGLLAIAQLHSSQAMASSLSDFFKAIQFDDEYRLNILLLKGMDPNTRNEQGFPAVTYAMIQNSPKSVALLLRAPGFDPNALDGRGETPLMVASALDKPQWVAALLAKGAKQGGHGEWTALHNAAASGSTASVDLLLKWGSPVDVLSPSDTTPLMMAARQGKDNTVRQLLKQGANPGLKNQAGYNAAGYAMKANRPELAMEIMKSERALRKPPLKPSNR